MTTRLEENPERKVVQRSKVGRRVPLPQNYIKATNEVGRALSKNHTRIQEINHKYGLKSN